MKLSHLGNRPIKEAAVSNVRALSRGGASSTKIDCLTVTFTGMDGALAAIPGIPFLSCFLPSTVRRGSRGVPLSDVTMTGQIASCQARDRASLLTQQSRLRGKGSIDFD